MNTPRSGPEPPTFPARRPPPTALRVALCLALADGLGVVGCGGSEDHKTLAAANERINDQAKENARLEKHVKDLQARLAGGEADLARRHEERLTSLRKDAEDRQARGSQLHEEKVAHLEGAIAGLRLELGAARREKTALQRLVDGKPRVEDARKARSGRIEVVLGLFGGLTLVVLVVVGSGHRLLRRRHDLLVVQRAASSPILER